MRKINSIPENYYKQTNNERDPFISCFPTSMINAGATVGLKFPEPEPGSKVAEYSQWEDRYDVIIHSDAVIEHFKDNRDVQDLLKQDYDYREIYAVEEWAFNYWMGGRVCKLHYNLSKADFFNIINRGGAIVTSGKFCRFKHVVCVNGMEYLEDTNALTNIIFDDPYGNPKKDYKPVGVGGDDVNYTIDEFWKATEKNGGIHIGISFLPNGEIYG